MNVHNNINAQTHVEQDMPHKDMYVMNLDLSRVFWIIAVGLFMLTFFFLFGYWLGSDTNYLEVMQKDNQNARIEQSRSIILNDDMKQTSNMKEVQAVTEQAMRKDNSSQSTMHKDNRNNDSIYSNGESTQEEDETAKIETVKEDEREKPPVIRRAPVKKLRDTKLSGKAHYAVQISTHRVKRNAYGVLKQLKDHQFKAYIYKKKNSRGQLLYIVRIGPFASEAVAQDNQIEAKMLKVGQDGIVVKK